MSADDGTASSSPVPKPQRREQTMGQIRRHSSRVGRRDNSINNNPAINGVRVEEALGRHAVRHTHHRRLPPTRQMQVVANLHLARRDERAFVNVDEMPRGYLERRTGGGADVDEGEVLHAVGVCEEEDGGKSMRRDEDQVADVEICHCCAGDGAGG